MNIRSITRGTNLFGRRAALWIGIWSLFLSLLMPIMSLQASDAAALAARGDETACEEGLVLDEQTGECVPADQQQQNQTTLECQPGTEPNAEGTGCVPTQQQRQQQQGCPDGTTFDEGLGQCVADQTEQQPSGVQVGKRICTPGTDWYSASYQELVTGCPESQQTVQFTHTGPDGRSSTDSVGAGFEWSPVAPGHHTIAEQIPQGYGQPIFYCGSYVQQQSNPLLNPTQVQNGNAIGWDLAEGEWLYCQVFNIPTGGDYGRILFHKYYCPDGYDFDPKVAGIEAFQNACQQTQPAVTWTVEANGNPVHEATSDQGGYAEYNEAPTGQLVLEEEPPDGYTLGAVFCSYHPDGLGNFVGQSERVSLASATSFSWQMEAGYLLDCYWYNIPAGDQIVIIKHWCPPNLAFSQQPTFDNLDQACNADGSGATFELDGPEGAVQEWQPQSPQGDPLAGGWQGVPPGDYSVTETGLGQSWTFQVFCYLLPTGELTGNGSPEQMSLADAAALEISVTAGMSWYCHWFNFTSDGGMTTTESENSVTVYKWECVPDTEPGQDQDYYQGEDQDVGPCETEHLGIPISLFDGNGEHATTTQANGTEWDNVALDQNGGFQISIDEPDGFGDPMVFCGTLDEDAQTMVPAPGGSWALTPTSEPFTYQCNVYDIPGDGNTITVYKWNCQPGAEYGQDQGYYEGDDQDVGPCETEHLDVTISLVDANGSHEMQTQANGTQWNNVTIGQEGELQLIEEIPAGYGDPMVFCWTNDGEPQPVQSTNGFVVPLPDTSEGAWDYFCNWYNIPSGDDYNYVDFYKYYCQGTPPEDAGRVWYEQNCEPVEGWDFELQYTGGGSTQTTDENGYASWSGVPTGTWTATEFLPESYETPIVFCRYTEWPDGAGVTGEEARFEASGGVYSNGFGYEGMRIECHWYNIGSGTNWIDLFKLWCPAGTPYDADFDNLRRDCEYRDQGVNLSVTSGGSTTSMTAQGQAPASWRSVPTGQWTIHEPPAEGYGPPIIWCQYLEWPDSAQGISGEPFPLTWANGGASWEFPYDGLRIACAIFNIPFEGSWIDITKWWCSETVTTPYEQSVDNLLESCDRYTDGMEFRLEYGDQSVPMSTDGDGNAEWSDIPTGPWAMHETIPEGYGDPVVWCRWVEWPDGVDIATDPFQVGAPSGSFSGDFKYPSMRLHCDIFNIPDHDPGQITIYKWYCPEGVPRDSSADYLRDTCELVTTGVSFTLAYGETSVPMTTDSKGVARWDGVPPGDWRLQEVPGQGYNLPVIYCQYVEWPDGADVSDELFQPEVAGFSISGSFAYPSLHLTCYWFNFGYDPGDSWVTVLKYLCPPGASLPDDLGVWIEGCSDTPMDGVSFELASDQYPDGLPKVTSGGIARWEGLADGDIRIQEAVPEGYDPPKIWCTTYRPTEGQDAVPALDAFEPVSAENGAWSRTIDDGPARIVCYVFNTPGEENTVTVYKYNCEYKPEGFNSLGEWLDACPARGNGVGFTLDNSEGPQQVDTVDGEATWSGVPEAPFTLSEEPQAGYGEPVVWCGWTAYYSGKVYDAFPQLVEAEGGVYHGDIAVPNTTWFCYWFNIPEDDSRITVYKYNCPEGVPQGTVESELYFYQKTCNEAGNGIEFTLDNSQGSFTQGILNGTTTWHDVPQGEFTITESIPPGYGNSIWWCGFSGYENGGVFDGFPVQVEAPGGVYSASIDFDVTYYTCWVFNFPDRDHTVTVYKWYCPEEIQSDEFSDWQSACDEPMRDVKFTHTDSAGSTWKYTAVNGKADWYGVEQGENSLAEHPVPGYFPPVVYCELDARYDDGAAYAEPLTRYEVTDYTVSKSLDYAEFHWICHFFNYPEGPGEITIYKWYCPPGYDVNAWNADPGVDCTQAQNGITFTLDQPVGPNQMSNTGDSMPGAVYFGGLDPGTYVVSETVPTDVESVFIWDCVGGDIPKVHPHPLTWGSVLNVDVAGGDSIVCNWYNVPEPEFGWITLYKYSCSTETYVSDVDCQIYEFGASFELFQVDGNVSKGVGMTNAGGQYTWDNLEEGAYSLDEISQEPCKITATNVDGDGNAWVDAGQGTVIKVYNCSTDTSTVPGKVPGKYPNTGVGPSGEGVSSSLQDTPEAGETPIVLVDGTPTDELTPEDFYAISCINGVSDAGGTPTAFESGADSGEADNELPPFLQTPDDEPTAEPTLAPEGTPSADEPCERGSLPEKLVINAANVNHEVEVLEIVDGVMQPPSGPNVVSWYKETARLGESNNMVIAGHLNWWNVPEGPFFYLDTLEEGDRIEVTGEDGNIYVFEVQWVRQESNLAPPDPEVVGPTDAPSLTLITCGGEWDSSISEYNARTVARAVQVDVFPADDAADASSDEGAMRLAA